MHGEVTADAVAGAVIEIEPALPEVLPRQGVELRAGGAVGKDRAGDRDMPAQHQREMRAHVGGRFARPRRCG